MKPSKIFHVPKYLAYITTQKYMIPVIFELVAKYSFLLKYNPIFLL